MEKGPLPIVLCEQGPYDLIDVFSRFSVILQPLNLNKVEFTYTSSTGKAAKNHKNASIPRLLSEI